MAEVNSDDPYLRGAVPKRLQEALLPLVDSASQVLATSLPHIPRYDIQNKLGEGGMAVVYRATDRELGRPVALKFLKETLGAHESTRMRFVREATSIAQIRHPNVVVVHDAGEAEGHPYLAMELIDGRPLSEMIAQRTHETSLLIKILEKASRGVAAAHQLGIIHRDLKPGNILVGHDDEPKVVDFGLAHLSGGETQITRSGAVVGTPPYMPPEQVQGRVKDISTRTDVYSLGAILYEILTGRPPFVGDSVSEIYGRILSEEPAAPRSFQTRISRDIEAIALKALEKDPARRYENAADFADDLHRFLAGEPVLAKRAGVMRTTLRWARRHRRVSALFGAVAIAALTGSVLATLRWREARERSRELLAKAVVDRDFVLDGEAEIAKLSVQLKDEEERVKPWSPWPEQRLKARLRTEIDSLTGKVAERCVDLVSNGEEAVSTDPGNAAARTFLADWYWSRLKVAEAEGDLRKLILAQKLVHRHDPGGRYGPQVRAGGTLKLATTPDGVECYIRRYAAIRDGRLADLPYAPQLDDAPVTEIRAAEEEKGKIVKSDECLLGVTPFTSPPLKQGSYVLVLKKKGFRDVRVPMLMTRGAAYDWTIPLFEEDEIGENFVYVPEGPYIAGGQTEVRANPRRNHESIPGFFISRLEVTVGEYVVYLNDRHWHTLEAAWKRSPREHRNPEPYLWGKLGDKIAPQPELFPGNGAVLGVSADDADDFCLWKTEVSRKRGLNKVFRLPTSDEWEKAARGVDGRRYPWGEVFDWSFTRGYFSRENPLKLDPVGTFQADDSPYGVRDMAGNLCEWTSTGMGTGERMRIYRGGAMFYGEPAAYQATYFTPTTASSAHNQFGIRLARDLPAR